MPDSPAAAALLAPVSATILAAPVLPRSIAVCVPLPVVLLLPIRHLAESQRAELSPANCCGHLPADRIHQCLQIPGHSRWLPAKREYLPNPTTSVAPGTPP